MHKAKETRKSVFLARLNKLVWDSTATLTPAERRTSEPGFEIRETRKGKVWMEEQSWNKRDWECRHAEDVKKSK
jgi:hypothetical protein